MNRWHRIALICGLLPLLTGITIFVIWLVTRWDWLMLAGYFTIVAGLLLFVGGVEALFVATRKAEQQGARYRRKDLLILGLLLMNFPVATAIVSYALHLMTTYDVLIVNELETPIHRIVLVDPVGKHHDIHDVPPHSQKHRRFSFDGEGRVTYQVKSADLEQSGILIGYITSDLGGRRVMLRIDSNGIVTINESVK